MPQQYQVAQRYISPRAIALATSGRSDAPQYVPLMKSGQWKVILMIKEIPKDINVLFKYLIKNQNESTVEYVVRPNFKPTIMRFKLTKLQMGNYHVDWIMRPQYG